jgi:hypothetical protein
MLDKNFIVKIADEVVNKFKNLNLETLNPNLLDPAYHWIQNDPKNEKTQILYAELNHRIAALTNCKNPSEQKSLIKKFIYTNLTVSSQLFFIMMYPINNQISYFPFSNLTNEHLDRFLLYLVKEADIISKTGITTQKDFLNGALIAQSYSINFFLYLILEEVALSLGIEDLKNRIQKMRKNMAVEIVEFIKTLDVSSKVDLGKVSFKYKLLSALNKKFEDVFLK